MISPTDTPPEDKTAKLSRFVGDLVDAKITPLIEDTRQQREQLDRLFHEIGNTNQSVSQIGAALTQLINTMNQSQAEQIAQAPTQNPVMPNLVNQLPPELKAQMVSGIVEAAANLIRAWRGSGSSSAPDPMSEMGKQLMADLFRATVDDIQQRVYGIRKIPPPGITTPHHSLE